MSDLNSQISKLVSEFVENVTALARRAAADTLTSALGARGGGRRDRDADVSPADSSAKRSANQLERVQARVIDFVKKHPGARIEQINEGLKTSTRDLRLPVHKLIASGVLKRKGEKRATAYFVGAVKKAKRLKKSK